MKSPIFFLSQLKDQNIKSNTSFFLKFTYLLFGLVFTYSVLFHLIMYWEGRDFSWLTGLYWTMTVMSTLGFGDITFMSDLGRFFSIIVLVSGIFLLLVIMPFMFTQYVYVPWMEAQKKARAPRSVPASIVEHVIIVGTSEEALNLADELTEYGFRNVILCNEMQRALELVDGGHRVVVGEHDKSETYADLNTDKAALVVALEGEMRNTNITFTIREFEKEHGIGHGVSVLARAEHSDAVDILKMAGCSAVFQFHKLLGEGLSRRVINHDCRSSVIDHFGELVVAEAPVMRTDLVGKTPVNCGLRNATGVNIVGLWERGKFKLPQPHEPFTPNTVLVLVGTEAQIASFNEFVRESSDTEQSVQYENGKVLILGGGRVGRAAADFLGRRGVSCCIVERASDIGTTDLDYVLGDAADREVLERAGLKRAPAVIITTHDDDTNIYLTIYCRRLRPDMQIVSRANLERNVGILHAAGADLVLSLSSMISSNVINMLSPGRVFMLSEGLSIFRTVAGTQLAGQTLKSCGIRHRTDCNVVAVHSLDGTMHINPNPDYTFSEQDDVYLIGDRAAEQLYYKLYGRAD